MGNSNSESKSSEWCDSIKFGNGVRKVDFFAKFFRISGTIVAVEEIVQNKIVLVVNKVRWYGIRLIIFDHRVGGDKKLQDRQHCQVVTLSGVLGVAEDTVNTHIRNIKDYFQNDKYVCYIVYPLFVLTLHIVFCIVYVVLFFTYFLTAWCTMENIETKLLYCSKISTT